MISTNVIDLISDYAIVHVETSFTLKRLKDHHKLIHDYARTHVDALNAELAFSDQYITTACTAW